MVAGSIAIFPANMVRLTIMVNISRGKDAACVRGSLPRENLRANSDTGNKNMTASHVTANLFSIQY